MTFQELQYYLEDNACSVDHFIDDSYLASNCINAEICIIERLPLYGRTTLVHYFYELGIPAPNNDFKEQLEVYRKMREELKTKRPIPIGVNKDNGKN